MNSFICVVGPGAIPGAISTRNSWFYPGYNVNDDAVLEAVMEFAVAHVGMHVSVAGRSEIAASQGNWCLSKWPTSTL